MKNASLKSSIKKLNAMVTDWSVQKKPKKGGTAGAKNDNWSTERAGYIVYFLICWNVTEMGSVWLTVLLLSIWFLAPYKVISWCNDIKKVTQEFAV